MSHTIIRIDSAPIRMNVSSAPVRLGLFAAQGPAGPAGPNVVNASTVSNGTANLSVSNLTTATGTVTGIMTAPTAVTLTSTTQVATTAFVQQELAAGTAVAKNLEFLARNQSGVTIPKGSIVYISDATGNKPLITLAQANNDANSAQTIGFVKTDIAHNGTGYVIVRGEIENLDTFDLNEGDQLYLSPTVAGDWTTTKPVAPQHLVYVGICLRAHVNLGIILVAIQNGYELEELHDVLITTPSVKQVIKRNAGNTLWINEAVAASDVTGLGSLATQSGTFSGDSSGTNTGDQDLSNLLSRRTYLEVNGTTPSFGPYLVDQDYLTNGRRVWLDGSGGSLLWDTVSWVLELDSGGIVYRATKASSSYEPWLLTGWTVITGSGQPTFDADPLITNSADPLGSGVSLALYLPADTNGGFLTAGTGGTLPITRGGTGATTAPLARTNLGSGSIGDPLFRANNIAELDAAMGITTVKKTSDQSMIVTSLTNVISFPVVANVKYRIWGELILQSTITSVGFTSELWFPVPDTVLGSGVMGWIMQTNGALTGIQLLTTTRSNWLGAYSGAAAVRRLPFDFTTRFTTSGTVSIACAQRTPDAANPSYCKAGTYMKYQIIDA